MPAARVTIKPLPRGLPAPAAVQHLGPKRINRHARLDLIPDDFDQLLGLIEPNRIQILKRATAKPKADHRLVDGVEPGPLAYESDHLVPNRHPQPRHD